MSLLKLPLPKRAHSLFYHKTPYQFQLKSKSTQSLHKFDTQINQCADQINSSTLKNNNSCNIKSCCFTKSFNGESFLENENTNTVVISSNQNVFTEELEIIHLPPLPSPNEHTFKKIFKEKIHLCNIIFNFSKSDFQIQGKKSKTKYLTEINEMLSKKAENSLLTDDDKDLIFEMINKNIFEQDPFLSNIKILPSVIRSNFVEGSWEHLAIAYKILNQFILLFPEKCNIYLVKKAVFLCNKPDINERENLAIFLKNYTKVHHEQFNEIWIIIKNALTNVLSDIYTPYCVDPIINYILMLIKSNIIPNHMNYISQILYSHLLPLFNHINLTLFFENLNNLISNILSNRPDDQLNAILYMIKHFPYHCGEKQPLFVYSLSSIIIQIKNKHFSQIAEKFFAFIAMVIESPNSKLAESLFSLLLKPSIRPIILSNYEDITTIIIDSLKRISMSYWDKPIQIQSQNVLIYLMGMKFEFNQNKSLNNLIQNLKLPVDSTQSTNKKENKQKNNQELAKTWAIILRVATKNDKSINFSKSLYKIRVEFLKTEQ